MAVISVTAANVLPGTGAKIKSGTAGATITAGQLLYKDSTDSNSLKPADADAEASAAAVGVALNGASDGQPVDYQVSGVITIGGTAVVGVPYFANPTAGAIGALGDLSAGDYVTYIGVGKTASTLDLKMHVSGVVVQA